MGLASAGGVNSIPAPVAGLVLVVVLDELPPTEVLLVLRVVAPVLELPPFAEAEEVLLPLVLDPLPPLAVAPLPPVVVEAAPPFVTKELPPFVVEPLPPRVLSESLALFEEPEEELPDLVPLLLPVPPTPVAPPLFDWVLPVVVVPSQSQLLLLLQVSPDAPESGTCPETSSSSFWVQPGLIKQSKGSANA